VITGQTPEINTHHITFSPWKAARLSIPPLNDLRISGTCDRRFAVVAEAFRENFEERGELGAAVAVVIDALAGQAPSWPPGEGHGYHVHTFGFLVGELVRRVSGERIGAFLRQEVAEACGAQVSFGLAANDRSHRAEYVFDPTLAAKALSGSYPSVDRRLRELAYLNPPGATGIGTVDTPAWRQAEIPSANLYASARGVARTYASLVDTAQPLLAPDILQEATREAASGEDLVLARPSRFGLGFQLSQPERPLGPNSGSFGHFGAGGSLGFADPKAGLAFGYVMNRGGPQWQDPRNRALIDAVYRAA
jgi:CubicO group peptidase (beta-lactamase class C family)